MKTKLKQFCSCVMSVALVSMLFACAAVGTQSGSAEIRSGVIEQITEVQIKSSHHKGVGAVVGGVAGLGLGSLIGAGTGRDVAMVLGAVGGALAGHEVQKKYDKPVPGQQIIVRTTSGVLVSVTQPVSPGLSKGQKVYIEGNGEGAKVLPQ
jgi:outer membrane lipoprotein SlyB